MIRSLLKPLPFPRSPPAPLMAAMAAVLALPSCSSPPLPFSQSSASSRRSVLACSHRPPRSRKKSLRKGSPARENRGEVIKTRQKNLHAIFSRLTIVILLETFIFLQNLDGPVFVFEGSVKGLLRRGFQEEGRMRGRICRRMVVEGRRVGPSRRCSSLPDCRRRTRVWYMISGNSRHDLHSLTKSNCNCKCFSCMHL